LEGIFAAGVIEPEAQEAEWMWKLLYPALINWEKKRLHALYQGRGIRPDPLNFFAAWERKRSVPEDEDPYRL
jgi:hypothetical protein